METGPRSAAPAVPAESAIGVMVALRDDFRQKAGRSFCKTYRQALSAGHNWCILTEIALEIRYPLYNSLFVTNKLRLALAPTIVLAILVYHGIAMQEMNFDLGINFAFTLFQSIVFTPIMSPFEPKFKSLAS